MLSALEMCSFGMPFVQGTWKHKAPRALLSRSYAAEMLSALMEAQHGMQVHIHVRASSRHQAPSSSLKSHQHATQAQLPCILQPQTLTEASEDHTIVTERPLGYSRRRSPCYWDGEVLVQEAQRRHAALQKQPCTERIMSSSLHNEL